MLEKVMSHNYCDYYFYNYDPQEIVQINPQAEKAEKLAVVSQGMKVLAGVSRKDVGKAGARTWLVATLCT